MSLKEKAALVSREGLPPIADPEKFVQTMLRWEQAMGTTYAALSGMLMASGTDTVDGVIEGFETFNYLCLQLEPYLKGDDQAKIENLCAAVKDRLVFVPAVTGLLNGMDVFENNLDGNLQEGVGDCVVCSAIFALLYSFAGGQAGAANRFVNNHTSAYLHPSGQCFDASNSYLAWPLKKDYRLFIGSLFAFITPLTISFVIDLVVAWRRQYDDLKLVPPDELDIFFSRMQCAAAVNPYNTLLYQNDIVLEGTQKPEESMRKKYKQIMRLELSNKQIIAV
jgi:hypothetical protein